jgi:hypothetical protein
MGGALGHCDGFVAKRRRSSPVCSGSCSRASTGEGRGRPCNEARRSRPCRVDAAAPHRHHPVVKRERVTRFPAPPTHRPRELRSQARRCSRPPKHGLCGPRSYLPRRSRGATARMCCFARTSPVRTHVTNRSEFAEPNIVLIVIHPQWRNAPIIVMHVPQFIGRGSSRTSPQRIHACERPLERFAAALCWRVIEDTRYRSRRHQRRAREARSVGRRHQRPLIIYSPAIQASSGFRSKASLRGSRRSSRVCTTAPRPRNPGSARRSRGQAA